MEFLKEKGKNYGLVMKKLTSLKDCIEAPEY